jgi:predicted esterase
VVRRRWLFLCCALAWSAGAQAEPRTVERETSLAQLYDVDAARQLSKTLPADRAVKFRLRLPPASGPIGVVVFVKPYPPGEILPAWVEPFDRRNLAWICAGEFGDRDPVEQRMLVAMMAVKLVEQLAEIDPHRVFIAGIWGGGHVASDTIMKFPERFAGALYISGGSGQMPEESLLPLARTRRFVFITGTRDNSRYDVRELSARYQRAGMTNTLLFDLPNFSHEYPGAKVLERALDYLLEVTPPAVQP